MCLKTKMFFLFCPNISFMRFVSLLCLNAISSPVRTPPEFSYILVGIGVIACLNKLLLFLLLKVGPKLHHSDNLWPGRCYYLFLNGFYCTGWASKFFFFFFVFDAFHFIQDAFFFFKMFFLHYYYLCYYYWYTFTLFYC